MDKQRLEEIERTILSFFKQQKRSRILTKELFQSSGEFAVADLVRAIEDLEKRSRFLVRYTQDGSDYISLTPEGATHAGIEQTDVASPSGLPHPPKSATKRL